MGHRFKDLQFDTLSVISVKNKTLLASRRHRPVATVDSVNININLYLYKLFMNLVISGNYDARRSMTF